MPWSAFFKLANIAIGISFGTFLGNVKFGERVTNVSVTRKNGQVNDLLMLLFFFISVWLRRSSAWYSTQIYLPP